MASSLFYRNIVMVGACALFLSGCSWLENWPPGGGGNEYGYGGGYQDFRPRRTQVMQSSDGNTWLQTKSRPLSNGDGRVSQKGWAVPGQDIYENQRLMTKKLMEIEEDVERMRYSFKRLLPALYRLAGTQEDLRETLQEITPHAGIVDINTPSVPPSSVPLTPVSRQENRRQQQQPQSIFPPQENRTNSYRRLNDRLEHHQPQTRASQSPASLEPASGYNSGHVVPQRGNGDNAPSYYKPNVGNSAAIRNIRFGEHADKTRIVLDTSREVSFNYDIDNNERILMINIPGAKWDGALQSRVEKSPLVASYAAMAGPDGGTRIAIQLKRKAQVKWAHIIPPSSGQFHRLVIDLVQI